MKKLLTLGLATALVASMGITTAFAAEYVDNDNNGVCDNLSSYSSFVGRGGAKKGMGFAQNVGNNNSQSDAGGNYVDADADGVCDNVGTGQGNGTGLGGNYVDADADGVCDNVGTGQGNGTGLGGNYVDTDEDGVCDKVGTGQGSGNQGTGKGRNR